MSTFSAPLDELEQQSPPQASSAPLDDLDAAPAPSLTKSQANTELTRDPLGPGSPGYKAPPAPRSPSRFSDVWYPRVSREAEAGAVRAASPRAAAEKAAGMPLADVWSPHDPQLDQPIQYNAKTGLPYQEPLVPEAEGWKDPLIHIAAGAEPIATGLSRYIENDKPVYGTDPNNRFGPVRRELSKEEEDRQSRERMLGASEVLEGSGQLGMVAVPASLAAAPIKTALGFGAGYLASEGAGKAVHGHVSPEAEELTRQVAFFIPSAAGTVAGIATGFKTSSLKAPGPRGTSVSEFSAFGDKVGGAVRVTPEDVTIGGRVGDTQIGKKFSRGFKYSKEPPPPDAAEAAPVSDTPNNPGQQRQLPQKGTPFTSRPPVPITGTPHVPEPSEAAKALASFEQHTGNPDFQPAPPPPVPPGTNGPEHLTPDVVKGVSDAIMQAPAANRPNLMTEAHGNMVKWMMGRGTFTGPDGKIHTVDAEGPAKKLASKFINDEVDGRDAEAEKAAKAVEQTPKAQAAAVSTTAPIAGKPPAAGNMTTDTAAVAKVATEANIHPEQKPAVAVKKEPPKETAALAQPPKPVESEAVAKIGKEDKASQRTILQPSDDVMQNERLAAHAAPELATKLSHIAAGVPGARFDRLRPQKELERVDEKVDDAGKPPETVPDYLAAQIAADTPQAKDQLIAALHKHFNVIQVEDNFLEGKKELANYRSANVQVGMGNGSTAEVQIVPREQQETANQSHVFYTKGREAELRGDHAERDKQFAKAAEMHDAAMEKFNQRNGIEPKPKHEFASTQINIDPNSELGQAHAQAVAAIPKEHVGKEGLEKTPHVTIRYGLKDDSPASIERIKAAAAQIQPFEVPIGKTDVFPATEHSSFDHPVIARLETTPELKTLRNVVEGAGAFKEDNFPEYKPHVTLGYIKKEFAQQYKGDNQLEGQKVPVKEITVSKRDGSQESISLGGQQQSHSAPLDELEAQTERRTNTAERKRVEHLTPEERAHELLTSELTGLPNKRAFAEDAATMAESHPHVGYADIDDFKAFNTELGHEGVDEKVLPVVGEIFRNAAAKEPGGSVKVYHRSGDEFLFRAKDEAAIGRVVDRVNKELQNAVFTAESPDGKLHTKQGAGVSHGTGRDAKAAESAAGLDKQRRKQAGLRSGARDVPESVGQEPATREQTGGREGAGQTISEHLNGRRSARIGTLTLPDNTDLELSVRPDISQPGTYSVVASNGKNSQSYRMQYKGGMPLAELRKDFEEYLNIDSGGHKVTIGAPRQPHEMNLQEFAANQGKPAENKYVQQQHEAVKKKAASSRAKLSADKLSDFQIGRDKVVREGDRTYVVDRSGSHARTEVQHDAITPEFKANADKLTPEQRERMIESVKTTPYLSEEGRQERLEALGEGRTTHSAPLEEIEPAPSTEPAKEVMATEVRLHDAEKKRIQAEIQVLNKERNSLGFKIDADRYNPTTETKALVERHTELGRKIRALDDEVARLEGQPTRAEKSAIEKKEAEKPFGERPIEPLKYGEPAQSQHWQVLEKDFIAKRFESEARRYERAIEAKEKEVAGLKPNSTKRISEESSLHFWKERLAKLKAGDDSRITQEFRNTYIKTVKEAISHGKPVPQAVIDQHTEFTKAEDARERYEKGKHTSFSNRSVAINDTMQKEYGFKVKRQDGKPITDEQIKEIHDSVKDVESVFGSMADIMRGVDLTIVHTNGKFPFLMNDAAGLFSENDRRITVGLESMFGRGSIPVLAHEIGHMIDIKGGNLLGESVRLYTKGGKGYQTTALSEADAKKFKGDLISQATETINNMRKVRELLRAKKTEDLAQEEKQEIETARVKLGPYWREPREVFARLFEQYVANRLGKRSGAAQSPQSYAEEPGYWTQQQFENLIPKIEAEINRRLDALHTKYGTPYTEGPKAGGGGTQVKAAEPVEQPKMTEAEVDAMVAKDYAAANNPEASRARLRQSMMRRAQRELDAGTITQAKFNELEQKYGTSAAREPIAQFDEAVKHTGAEVKEGKPSEAFAEKIKEATHLEPSSDAELKEKFTGAAYQREYFKAALGQAKAAWAGTMNAKGNGEEMFEFVADKGLTHYDEKQAPEGFKTPHLYIKVPDDGHFLVNNWPNAIQRALKGATRGFAAPRASFNPEAKVKEFSAPKVLPADYDKYEAGLKAELKTLVSEKEGIERNIREHPILRDELTELKDDLAKELKANESGDKTNTEKRMRATEIRAKYEGQISYRQREVDQFSLAKEQDRLAKLEPQIRVAQENIHDFALSRQPEGAGRPAGSPEARPAEPAKEVTKVRRPEKQSPFTLTSKELPQYFTPGKIVTGYAGQRDKVIAFHPADSSKPYPDNRWSVDVVSVDAHGEPIAGERVRHHATMPDRREIAKFRREAEVKGKPSERGFARLDIASLPKEAFTNYLEKRRAASHYTTQARLLEEGLASLDRKYEADVLDTRNMLRSVARAFKPEEQEAVYHAIEAGRSAGLSDKEKALKDDFVKPVQAMNQALREELTGFGWGDLYPQDGYIHRIVEGKPGRLESAAQGQQGGKGNLLSRSTPSTKERRMFALEDEDGHRIVVHKADGKITAFDQGKPVDMGAYRSLKPEGQFTDKDGQDWTLKQATTKEIEDATDIRYYKSAMAVTALDNLELQRAVNAARFLESFKSRPDFDSIAMKAEAGEKIPAGWKHSQIPQFRGYAFEPRTREVLDDLHDRMTNYQPPTALEKIGDFLQTSVLLNPLMHVANMADIWATERGALRTAQIWKADNSVRAGMRALQAVTTRNDDYLNALRFGAPLMSHKLLVRDLNRAFQDVLTGEIAKDKGLSAKVREAMALPADVNPIEAIRGASHSGAFMSNDIFLLQSVYDKMETSGVSFEAALRQTMRTFPEYRVPTRVADSKMLADLMKNRLMTWFSGYHYGKWRAFRNMAADSVRPGASAEDRKWALSRIAMLGLLVAVVYPAYQALVNKLSSDPSAKVKRFGLSGTVQNMIDVHEGKKDITQAVESEVTPSALLKGVVETATNRDSFTGNYVRDPNASGLKQAEQSVKHLAGSAIGPVSQYRRYSHEPGGLKKFLWSQIGVSFPRTETETKAAILMNRIRREHYAPMTPDEQDEFEKKMQRIAEGKLTPQEMHSRIKSLMRNEFENGMKSFTYDQAKQVYDVASPEEKAMIGLMLLRKRFNSRGAAGVQ